MQAHPVLYGLQILLNHKRYSNELVGTVAFMIFTIVYFTGMANFFDLGENNRFRFALDPLVLVLFGLLLQSLVLYILKRRSRE